MNSLKDIKIKEEYRTGSSNLVEDFYRPCFSNSHFYDRAVGYFRSSVFLLITPEIIDFSKKNGKIRMLCSPHLSPEDIDIISKSYQEKNLLNSLISDIDKLYKSEETRTNTEVLATLVTLGILEIKIAFRPNSSGIYHEKIGIFTDRHNNSVSFKGSTNETWAGWHENGNYESFDVFCSWEAERESNRVKKAKLYFDNLWRKKVSGLEIIDFPDICIEKLKTISKDSLDDIQMNKISNFYKEKQKIMKREPFPHQISALKAWEAQGKVGILEHATGSGKTFTALTAMKEHLDGGGIVLILVPDRLLHRQWVEEVKEEIEDVIILKAGDGNNLWKKNKRLRYFSSPGDGLGKRVVIATMQTARVSDFRQGVYGGDHLLIVADEVHEIGSPENSKVLMISAGLKLGLSATPTRYGDPVGTQRMLDYFGPIVKPPYTLNDAIADGRLVEYEYFPEPIRLTADESDNWESATKEISREYARSKRDTDGTPVPSPRLKTMLIQRSRIAKKASAKIPYAIRVVQENYQKGESWLIYCEDQYQLREVMSGLEEEGYKPLEYHTSMRGNSEETLDWFKNFGGILVSIRCLDQGIDIPKISHAIILASSQNPRQFIQRRGRVLRKYQDLSKDIYKFKAVIFDAVVVPISLEIEPGQLSLLKSELQRSIQFSRSAMNQSGSHRLNTIAIELGIDPEEFTMMDTDGIEEEWKDDNE